MHINVNVINLRQLEITAGSEEGARVLFEKLIAQLVALKHQNVREIEPCPGDWGIDALQGELSSGSCIVWQSKYFINGIGDAQKDQIRSSFKQLVKKAEEEGHKIDAWYLCVPCKLSPEVTKWWEKWSKEQTKETGIQVKLMEETEITRLLLTPDATGIVREFFGPRQPEEREIIDPPIEKIQEYDNSLFVKKMDEAGIKENMSARSQFFNAEIVKQEVHDKGDGKEAAEMVSLYEKIRSMWETRFNAAIDSDNPQLETREVYYEMLKNIEDKHDSILRTDRLKLTFVHKQGLMQQLADLCTIGWSPNFRELDGEG